MPSRSPSIQSTSRLDRLLEFYQELDPNYNPYKHHQNQNVDEEEDIDNISTPDSLSVAGRTDSESWAFDSPNGQHAYTSNNNDLPVAPYYVNKAQAEAFAVGREHLQFPLLPSELTCDPMYASKAKAYAKPQQAQQHAPPPPPPLFTTVADQPTNQQNSLIPVRAQVPSATPMTAPPPAYHRPPPYIAKDQPIRAVKNLKVTALKVENASRFMPPPPPSMQAARVMSVVGLQKQPSCVRPIRKEADDGRTCHAEGEFAFLAKTPGTSDWVRGGYGATYAATVAEGAPAESFSHVDIHDESFQSLLRVMMRWYVRVAGLFGCASPSSASDAPTVNVAAARSHLRPTERLPRSYFARTAVPPCPSPFAYFTTAEHGDLHIVSDLKAFVAWHDAVHGWWDMHVRPRSVGHVLHKQLCQAQKVKASK